MLRKADSIRAIECTPSNRLIEGNREQTLRRRRQL